MAALALQQQFFEFSSVDAKPFLQVIGSRWTFVRSVLRARLPIVPPRLDFVLSDRRRRQTRIPETFFAAVHRRCPAVEWRRQWPWTPNSVLVLLESLWLTSSIASSDQMLFLAAIVALRVPDSDWLDASPSHLLYQSALSRSSASSEFYQLKRKVGLTKLSASLCKTQFCLFTAYFHWNDWMKRQKNYDILDESSINFRHFVITYASLKVHFHWKSQFNRKIDNFLKILFDPEIQLYCT